jgi:HSP20 family protein
LDPVPAYARPGYRPKEVERMELDLWDEMRTLERRFDDLFRAFVAPKARVYFPAVPKAWHRPFAPATDVFARKDDLVIRMELPGIDPAKDVKITVQDGELLISGERKKKEEIKEDHFYRMETSYGAFERHIPLFEGLDETKIKAEYREGILEVVMPAAAKAMEAPKAKIIPIKTAA